MEAVRRLTRPVPAQATRLRAECLRLCATDTSEAHERAEFPGSHPITLARAHLPVIGAATRAPADSTRRPTTVRDDEAVARLAAAFQEHRLHCDCEIEARFPTVDERSYDQLVGAFKAWHAKHPRRLRAVGPILTFDRLDDSRIRTTVQIQPAGRELRVRKKVLARFSDEGSPPVRFSVANEVAVAEPGGRACNWRFKRRYRFVYDELFAFDLTEVKQGATEAEAKDSASVFEVEIEYLAAQGSTPPQPTELAAKMMRRIAEVRNMLDGMRTSRPTKRLAGDGFSVGAWVDVAAPPVGVECRSTTRRHWLVGHASSDSGDVWLLSGPERAAAGAPPRALGADVVQVAADRLCSATPEPLAYLLAEKTNGERFLLLAVEDGAYLVDRRFEVLRLPDSLDLCTAHRGAVLLDGELVLERSLASSSDALHFLVFDACAVDGVRIGAQPLTTRLAAAADWLRRRCVRAPDASPFMTVGLKSFFRVQDVGFVARSCISRTERGSGEEAALGLYSYEDPLRPGLRHGNDGLIFTPVPDAYRNGTVRELLKWKPREMNSIDFQLIEVRRFDSRLGRRTSRFQLGVISRGEIVMYEWLTYPERAAELELLRDGAFVECVYDPHHRTVSYNPDTSLDDTWDHPTEQGGGWRVERLRMDKKHPNSLRVARDIRASLAEDLSCDELVEFLTTAQPAEADGHSECAPLRGARA
jgi:mRNA guanylyltransferase